MSDVDIDTLTLDDGQNLVYDETEGKWVNGSASGGGHTIVDNSGTSLAQEPKLKFNGMYVYDDSTNQTTVGEYYREMTTADYNQLSATEKQGMIRLTDNNYVCNINEVENADATHIPYDSNTSVKEKIDEISEYSTSETVVGTWKNGKPMYQKTIAYGLVPSSAESGVDHNVSNIDEIVGFEGYIDNGSAFVPLPYIYYATNNVLVVRYYISKTKVFVASNSNTFASYNATITMRYTKTTD